MKRPHFTNTTSLNSALKQDSGKKSLSIIKQSFQELTNHVEIYKKSWLGSQNLPSVKVIGKKEEESIKSQEEKKYKRQSLEFLLGKLLNKIEQRQGKQEFILNQINQINQNLCRMTNVLGENSKNSQDLQPKPLSQKDIPHFNQQAQQAKSNNFHFQQQQQKQIQSKHPDNDIYMHPKEGTPQQQVLLWVSRLVRKILSQSFELLKTSESDLKRVKRYFVQKTIKNLIFLPKSIKQQYWQAIEKSLKHQILAYNRQGYSLIERQEISNALSGLVIERQELNPQDDIVYNNGLKVTQQKGNYLTSMVKILNFTFRLSNSNGITQKKDQIFKDSLATNFRTDMQKLLQQMEAQQDFIQFSESGPEGNKQLFADQRVLDFVDKNLSSIQKANHHEKKIVEEHQRGPLGQQKRKKIRLFPACKYTQEDLFKNEKQYSQEQMNENINIENPSVHNLLERWCYQLQKCFYPQEILNRQDEWKMKDRSLGYLRKNRMIALYVLLQVQKQKINKDLMQALRKSSRNQVQLSTKQVASRQQKMSQYEAKVGQFCSSVFKSTSSFIFNYLNMLISAVSSAERNFEKMQRVAIQQEEIFNAFSQQDKYTQNKQFALTELAQLQQKIARLGKKPEALSETPQLLTFKIDFVLRCKFEFKQEEIISLLKFYKLLECVNKNRPSLVKILKVKNLLKGYQNAILINILYHSCYPVEISLKLKCESQKFRASFNEFNCFLKQLQNCQFGLVTKMCNIWVQQNPNFKGHLKEENKMNKGDEQEFRQILEPFSLARNQGKQFIALIKKNLTSEHISSINGQIKSIRKLNLSENGLKNIKIVCEKFPNAQLAELSHNQFDKIQKKDLQLWGASLTRLYLTQNKLLSIAGVAELEKLIELRLQRNNIKEIGGDIGELQFLMRLNISQNKISNLPPQFGKLTKLQVLNISKNQLTQIPGEFKNLENLFILDISWNKLNKLTNQICKLQKLSQMNISNNRLTQLPVEFGLLSKLKHLKISENQLKQLPDSFGSLLSLETFQIYNNQLIRLPNSFGKLQNLQQFVISFNQLIQLPPQIGNLSNLFSLDVANNQLSSLPCEFGCLKNVVNLFMSNNQLAELPRQFGNLKSLIKLDISQNQINELPLQFGNLANIVELNISYNHLKKLDSLKHLHTLIQLNICYNQLTQIPHFEPNLSHLQILDAYNNKFSSLPPFILHFNHLKAINLRDNQLTELPKQIGNLDQLCLMNISDNRLTSLPLELMNLVNLIQLNLSFNQITRLPDEYENLKNLKTFLILNNNLQEFPKFLLKLQDLQVVSISLPSESCEAIGQGIKGWSKMKKLSLNCTIPEQAQLINQLGQMCEQRHIQFVYSPSQSNKGE